MDCLQHAKIRIVSNRQRQLQAAVNAASGCGLVWPCTCVKLLNLVGYSSAHARCERGTWCRRLTEVVVLSCLQTGLQTGAGAAARPPQTASAPHRTAVPPLCPGACTDRTATRKCTSQASSTHSCHRPSLLRSISGLGLCTAPDLLLLRPLTWALARAQVAAVWR
jgi:hypothetical protein